MEDRKRNEGQPAREDEGNPNPQESPPQGPPPPPPPPGPPQNDEPIGP